MCHLFTVPEHQCAYFLGIADKRLSDPTSSGLTSFVCLKTAISYECDIFWPFPIIPFEGRYVARLARDARNGLSTGLFLLVRTTNLWRLTPLANNLIRSARLLVRTSIVSPSRTATTGLKKSANAGVARRGMLSRRETMIPQLWGIFMLVRYQLAID